MKKLKLIIFILSVMFLFGLVNAEAKWWIFGQSNEAVTIDYLYINKVTFDEGGPSVTLYRQSLPEGMIVITGRASVQKGRIGSVTVTVNGKEKWENAAFSDNGAFEFRFKPELGKKYEIFVEVMDTSGKTNNVDDTRKEVIVSDRDIRSIIKEVLDAMLEAYMGENNGRFMSFVSNDFAGDEANLSRAIQTDFTAFNDIHIRYTLNGISSGSKGIYVSVQYKRSVISSREGKILTDSGTTEFVFRTGADGPKLFSMKNPLIFGMSDASEVATGTVKTAANNSVLIVDRRGNATVIPSTLIDIVLADESFTVTYNDDGTTTVVTDDTTITVAADGTATATTPSDVESGTNILLVSEGNPPTGFDFLNGATQIAGGDFMVTGGNATPPAFAYGFLNNGATIVNLGAGDIDTVTDAPAVGYTNPGGINFLVGNTFAFKLGTGKYALLEVKSITLLWVVDHTRYTVRLDYKYQPDGSRNF